MDILEHRVNKVTSKTKFYKLFFVNWEAGGKEKERKGGDWLSFPIIWSVYLSIPVKYALREGEKKEKKEACKSKIFKSQKKRSGGGLFFLKIKDLMRYS